MQEDDLGAEARERLAQGRRPAEVKPVRERLPPLGFAAIGARAVRQGDRVPPPAQLPGREEHVGLGSAEGADSFVDEEHAHGPEMGRRWEEKEKPPE